MSFTLKKTSHLPRRLRKLARSRIHKTQEFLDPLPKAAAAQDQAIHESRKFLKQLHALLALLAPTLSKKQSADLDESIRTIAHPIGPTRDATAILETLQKTAPAYPRSLTPRTLAPILRLLQSRRTKLRHNLSLKKSLAALHNLEKTIDTLDFPRRPASFSLRESYLAARRAAHIAAGEPTDETLHDLRKNTKTFRYQLELLRPLLSKKPRALIPRTHRLTDLLGADHDLALLAQLLTATLKSDLPLPAAAPLLEAITHRRLHLQAAAHTLAEKIYRPPRRKSLTIP